MYEMFETLDEVEEYLGGSFIKCLICGGEYQALGNHLRLAHAWNCQDYKLHYGIPRTRKLVSDRLHQKLSAAADKMMAVRGTEWEVNFKEKGREFHGGQAGKTWIPVPAVARKLRQIGVSGCKASHEKFAGTVRPVTCPACGIEHEVSAWASFRRVGVFCGACLKAHINERDRNRPNKAERSARQNAKRRKRLADGEIISSLAQEIYQHVVAQDGTVATIDIINAIWPRYPGLARENFKKRICDLLDAKRLVTIRPGVYRAA